MEAKLAKAFSFIPSVSYLIEQVGVVAFGSFVRYFATQKEDEITKEKVEKFIKKSDIDMYINLSINHASLMKMRQICKHIFDLGGHIEFTSSVYPNLIECCDSVSVDSRSDSEYDPSTASIIRYGCYCCWIPSPTVRFIKLDLLVKTPTSQIRADYTVNALEYGNGVEIPESYANDLCDKIIRPISPFRHLKKYDVVKKLYRMTKIWKKKYRPETTPESIEAFKDAFEYIEDFDGDVKFYKANGPSYDDHQHIIRNSKVNYSIISMKEFNDNPIIQEIKMWLKN